MKRSILSLFVLSGLIMADFIRDDSLEVVSDTTTCLMWQDDANSKTVIKNWTETIEYCHNLNFAGYDDWRLPNIYELISITNEKKYDPAIQDKFENVVSGDYWSATTSASDTSNAWVVNFNYGFDGYGHKTSGLYVRCVRDGQ